MLLAPAARADSGFLLPPPSAEALGRAGAVAADTDEPAAVWLNPSALAFVGAPAGASVGLSLLDLNDRGFPPTIRDGRPGHQPSRPGWSPSLYGHLRVHDRVTIGLGGHVPYGFSTEWPDGWVGSQQAISTRFYAAAVTGVVAVRSAIAGRSRRASVRSAAIWTWWPIWTPALAAGRWSPSPTGRWPPTPPPVSVGPPGPAPGRRVHSRVALVLSGDADFSATNPAFAEIFADQPARLELTVPDVAVLAALYRPRPGLSLTLELMRASFGVLDQFHLDFDRPGTADLVVERGRRNPLGARAGVAAVAVALAGGDAGGLSLDDSATANEFQSPFAPDGRRVGVAIGAGYLVGRGKLDVGYQYTHFLPADARSPRMGPLAPPRGTYRTRLHTLALTVTAK